MSKNRFARLQAVKQLQDNKQTETDRSVEKVISVEVPAKVSLKENMNPRDSEIPRRGRPNGKRSNSEFQQVTAYVRRDTYRKVSIRLLDREIKGEFSELIEELLQKWINE